MLAIQDIDDEKHGSDIDDVGGADAVYEGSHLLEPPADDDDFQILNYNNELLEDSIKRASDPDSSDNDDDLKHVSDDDSNHSDAPPSDNGDESDPGLMFMLDASEDDGDKTPLPPAPSPPIPSAPSFAPDPFRT